MKPDIEVNLHRSGGGFDDDALSQKVPHFFSCSNLSSQFSPHPDAMLWWEHATVPLT